MTLSSFRPLALAIAIPAAALAVGCGSSSSSSSTTASTPATTAQTGPSTIAVGLSEMKIVPDPTSAPAGKVTFDVVNNGAIPHEMVVIKTDKAAGDLGTGSTVPETGSVGETGDIAAGAKKTVSFDLKSGHYALICNIPGHYAAGMHADFNVN
ncbi:MAG: plastocyanin/azurin family copper-binding protein [Actinomycetes bacterium]